MNNSIFAIEGLKIQPDEKVNIIPILRERQTKITKTLTALDGLAKSKEWSSLKEEVFDGLVERLSVSLFTESKKVPADVATLANLSGQLEIAERFDLVKYQQKLRNELISIKKQLNG